MGRHAQRDPRHIIDASVWVSIWPGSAIVITVLGFNFLGDGLRHPRPAPRRRRRQPRGRQGPRSRVDRLSGRPGRPGRADRRRERRVPRSAATSRSRAGGSSRSATSRARRPRARSMLTDGSSVRFRRPDSHSDFTLLDVPDGAIDDLPARAHDRGRRRLRLDVRARVRRLSPVHRGAHADVRLRRADRVGLVRRAPFLPEQCGPLRTWPGSSATTPCATRPASSRPSPFEEELQEMEWHVAPRRSEAGALGLSGPGSKFDPGRSAPTEGFVPRTRWSAASTATTRARPEPRRAPGRLDRGVPDDRPPRAVRRARSRTSTCATAPAQPRAWRRGRDTMAAARDGGMDVLADTTPFRDGLGQMAGILPQWVLADGWEEAQKRLRDPGNRERLRGDCDRYWRSSTTATGSAFGSRPRPSTGASEGHSVRPGRGRMGLDPWDALRDPRRGRPRIESLLSWASFHRPRAPGRDASRTRLLARGRRLHGPRSTRRSKRSAGHPVCLPGTSTTSPTTSAS